MSNQKFKKRDFPLFHESAKDVNLEPPKSTKDRYKWLQVKARKIIETNTYSELRIRVYERYLKDLNQAIDYLEGYIGYNEIRFGARRILMFLLSCNKVWYINKNQLYEPYNWLGVIEKLDKVIEFIHAEVLPKYRQQVIKDFLYCQDTRKSLQEWELVFLNNKALNDTEVMYQTGRPYAEILRLRHKPLE